MRSCTGRQPRSHGRSHPSVHDSHTTPDSCAPTQTCPRATLAVGMTPCLSGRSEHTHSLRSCDLTQQQGAGLAQEHCCIEYQAAKRNETPKCQSHSRVGSTHLVDSTAVDAMRPLTEITSPDGLAIGAEFSVRSHPTRNDLLLAVQYD